MTPSSTSPSRGVLPRCLLDSAPASFQIIADDGRRVRPTLAGYSLRRGAEYELRIQAQGGQNCVPTLTGPKWLVEAQTPPEQRDGEHVIRFHTGGHGIGVSSLVLTHGTLDVALRFPDGREPHCFDIPVVLAPMRGRWVAFTIATVVVGALTSRALQPDWLSVFE